MNLTIVTQYFPPEVGAPQNRLFELAVRLKQKGVTVNVITAMPNYPKMEIQKDYKGKWFFRENMEGLNVMRAPIFVTKNKSIVFRLLNYFSFVFTSFIVGLIKSRKTDVVICESPPLFLGVSACLLAKIKRAKFVFNVSDLWPESAEELGLVTNKYFLNAAYWLEKQLYKQSDLISGQTKGIVKNIKDRFPDRKVVWLPNGVDPLLFEQNNIEPEITWRESIGIQKDQFVILYAGIMGYAQGLDIIIDCAERFVSDPNFVFVMLGNGPEKDRLIEESQKRKLSNIKFLNFVQKKEMPAILREINASVVPLKKLPLFLGAIPSKIFECLASSKPILLGVNGEAKELFINEGNCGVHFEPENVHELQKGIQQLKENPKLAMQLGENGKQYVSSAFNRDTLASNFYNDLLSLF